MLFETFQREDAVAREAAMDQISQLLESWTRAAYASPPPTYQATHSNRQGSSTALNEVELAGKQQQQQQQQDDGQWDEVFDVESEPGTPDVNERGSDHVITPRSTLARSISSSYFNVRASSLGGRMKQALPSTKDSGRGLEEEGEDMWLGPYGLDELMFASSNTMSNEKRTQLVAVLAKYYVGLLRLSLDCPYAHVRKGSRLLLRRLQKIGAPVPYVVHVSPSWFIPAHDIIGFVSDDAAATAPTPRNLPRANSLLSLKSENTSTSSLNNGPLGSPLPSFEEEADSIIHQHGVKRGPDEIEGTWKQQHHGASSTASGPIPIGSGVDRSPARSPASQSRASFIHDNNNPSAPSMPRRARFSNDIRAQSSTLRSSESSQSLQRRQPPLSTSTSLRDFQRSQFLTYGHYSNYFKVLSYFTRFSEILQQSYSNVIYSQAGPLPLQWKVYVAILAASQYECQYGASAYAATFLSVGGDPNWLRGIDHAPVKIQRIARLNNLLAVAPWKITRQDIADLIRPIGTERDVNWTAGDVVQLILVLAMIHAESSFVLGCGIVPEVDTLGGTCLRKPQVHRNNVPLPTSSSISSGRHHVRSSTTPQSVNLYLAPFASTSATNGNSTDPASSTTAQSTFRSNVMIIPNIADETDEDDLPPNETVLSLSQPAQHPMQTLLQRRKNSMSQPKDDLHIDAKVRRKESFAKAAGYDDAPISAVPQRSGLAAGITNAARRAANSAPSSLPAGGLMSVSPLKSPKDISPASSTADLASLNMATPHEMPANPIVEDLHRFRSLSEETTYEDFDVKSEQYGILHLGEDFSWEEQGCALVNQYLPGVEENLDMRFSSVIDAGGDEEDMFFSASNEQPPLDTRPLREAVMQYSHRLQGISIEGYDYNDVNILINRATKRYLKRLCVAPWMICHQDWQGMQGLRNDEKVFLALLASEAKFYGMVCYGLRAVDRFLT